MRKPSPGSVFHQGVMERDNYACRALHHDKRCNGRAEHAHHCVYRAHLTDPALWLLDNGIALSEYCQTLAHRTHNGNLPKARLIAAVDAVNAIQGEMPGQHVPYFFRKNIA